MKKSQSKKKVNYEQIEKSKKYFFKRYKVREQGKRHPKLITDQKKKNGKDFYVFMGFTEQSLNGHKKNIKLVHNPKKGDMREAYLRKEQRIDVKSNFSNINGYYLSKEDELKVDEYIKKRQKKK